MVRKYSVVGRNVSLLALLLFVSFSLAAQSLEERIKSLPDIISVEKMEQNGRGLSGKLVDIPQDRFS